MRTNLIVLLLLTVANGAAYGQYASSSGPGRSDPKGETILLATGKSIPNPNFVLRTVGFLRDESIVNELRLDDAQRREIKALLDETSGQPSIIQERPREKHATKEDMEAWANSIIKRRETRAKEILDPIQIARLEQIVRQVEVSRVGFANAILQGFLGQDAGVQDNEKPALEISFDAIKSEYARLRAAIANESQKELLSLLSEDQRLRIPRLLGKPFEMHEEPIEKLRRLATEKVSGIVPDPESLIDSRILLKNQSVVDELKLTNEQLVFSMGAILTRKSDGESMEGTFRSKFEPSQLERLKQIVYQLEVARSGFGVAIADGYLGKAIDISDSQRPQLREKAKEIVGQTKAVLDELEEATRRKLLSHLTNTQRQELTKLLGKPFKLDEKK